MEILKIFLSALAIQLQTKKNEKREKHSVVGCILAFSKRFSVAALTWTCAVRVSKFLLEYAAYTQSVNYM